jgi:uncharacterized protein (TIGR03790 family)
VKLRSLTLLLVALLPFPGLALGPHEVVVLANRKSLQSVRVATEFAELRRIPQVNIINLDIPVLLTRDRTDISPDEFTRYIWVPATNAIDQHGISDHILAWVYSVDFPTRIRWAPSLSIQGITFLRNRLPESRDQVERGLYSSPLFAGPDGSDSRAFPAQSFDVMKAWLTEDMPIPSMMLGITGKYGNSLNTILGCLKRGMESDCTTPPGKIYLITGTDIRAQAREWQFPSVQRELAAARVTAVITNVPPARDPAILGIMMGLPNVKPQHYGQYTSGSFADHLTSAAGAFDAAHQTKLTAWIEAGATVSAGTVTEPFAIWSKFPSARVYAHQVAGCTLIESLYQSIKCPLQILLVGEPFAAPWSPCGADKLMVRAPEEGKPLSGKITAEVEVESGTVAAYTQFMFLLDGKMLGKTDGTGRFEFDTTLVKNGPHAFRVVAYRTGAVRSQIFVDIPIDIRNRP